MEPRLGMRAGKTGTLIHWKIGSGEEIIMKAKKKDYDYEQMVWLEGKKTMVREGSYSL